MSNEIRQVIKLSRQAMASERMAINGYLGIASRNSEMLAEPTWAINLRRALILDIAYVLKTRKESEKIIRNINIDKTILYRLIKDGTPSIELMSEITGWKEDRIISFTKRIKNLNGPKMFVNGRISGRKSLIDPSIIETVRTKISKSSDNAPKLAIVAEWLAEAGCASNRKFAWKVLRCARRAPKERAVVAASNRKIYIYEIDS